MNAVSQLDHEWSSIATGEVAEGLARWRREERSLRRFASPPQLLGFLGLATGPESDAPLLALLSLAPREPLAGRLLLQAILPALKAQSARISHPRATPEELWELLLFHAWQTIRCYPVARRRRRVAANLVLRVLEETTRELRRGDPPPAGSTRRGDSRTPLPAAAAAAPLARGEGEREVLPTARAGELAARDAEPILDTRLEGIALGSLAPGAEVKGGAPLQPRRRAENRLAQRLAASGESHDTTNSDRSSRAE